MIAHEEIEPLKLRLNRLEGGIQSLSPSRATIVDISGETPSTTMKHWRLEHQKLMDEMKRRRMFYLRKTPMDQRIEDIMKQ